TTSSFTPLIILLEYPPIAHLTNAYLTAFNSLRLLAATSLYYPIGSHLSNSLLSMGAAIKRYGEAISNDEHSLVILQGFCATFGKIFVPYIARCYVDGVYGGLLHVDGSTDDSEGKSASSIVDQNRILEILKDFLPV